MPGQGDALITLSAGETKGQIVKVTRKHRREHKAAVESQPEDNKIETKLSKSKIIEVTQFGSPNGKLSIKTKSQQVDPMYSWVMKK